MSQRVVFMGTPEFAVPTLERLATAGHDLVVVTQPARPAGRGRRLRASPVRQAAEDLGLPVLEREHLRDAAARAPLAEFRPDFIVVVAFGLILRQRVLALPRQMPVNLHPSRLPELRGVAPIPWTIWQGCTRTAVTTMRMDMGVDTGDILLVEEVDVGPRETAGELAERLATVGADLVVRTLSAVPHGQLTPMPQADAGATYAPRLEKAHGHVDWCRSAEYLDRLIRAMTPWPRARARYAGQEVCITRARPEPGRESEVRPGTVVAVDREGIEVATGDGRLRLLELQPAGKGTMEAPAFARGRHLQTGDCFETLPVEEELEWPRPVHSEG
jgi:methionyl-tRNA formyltransferase